MKTTAPATMKDAPVNNHIIGIKGLMKARALYSVALTGATITRPDSKKDA